MNAQPEYKNAPKNIWRRRWWKSAAKRCAALGIRPMDARVLYMPGPGDVDRGVAIKNGFHACNLIGIDRDSGLCSDLRKRGVTMINGDVIDAIGAWSPQSLPDVILLDTCSSVSNHFSRFLSIFKAGNFYNRSMVFGLNLVHGRDSALNIFRSTMKLGMAPIPHCYNPRRGLFAPHEMLSGDGGQLHRGLAVGYLVMEQLLDVLGFIPDDVTEEQVDAMYKALWIMDMEIDQYQSDGAVVKMDSVIFNWSHYIRDKKTLSLIKPKRIRGYKKTASSKIAAGLAIGSIKNKKINSAGRRGD